MQVVQEAICPEKKRGLDDQLSAVASITEVYVSGDLQVRMSLETAIAAAHQLAATATFSLKQGGGCMACWWSMRSGLLTVTQGAMAVRQQRR